MTNTPAARPRRRPRPPPPPATSVPPQPPARTGGGPPLLRLTTRIGAFGAAVTLIVTGCSTGAGPAVTASVDSGEQSATAGDVTVAAVPTVYDATGARIRLRLDTRSGRLDLALPRAATLTIAGRVWPARSWHGDPPGGHHREGTLLFTAAGPLTGTATLTLTGLPGPVQLTWPVPEPAHTVPSR